MQQGKRPTKPTAAPGATCLGGERVRFRVWAPRCRQVALRVVDPVPREPVAMAPALHGWFEIVLEGLGPGTRYVYVLDGERERPDPMSRAQPEGVHGPSEVVDTNVFAWTASNWRGLSLREMVLYEIHVGTFTTEGTFEAVIPRLDRLQALGVTAIELMPVASFPGARNWGYDGVGLFAPQRTYGGPVGLQRLVDACHTRGLAVVLDVVYNHLGPEGNYLAEFGPYFTDRYRTPWGAAVNYDGEDARGVRDFVIANAVYWIREYRIDGLRLDAIHGIFDARPHPHPAGAERCCPTAGPSPRADRPRGGGKRPERSPGDRSVSERGATGSRGNGATTSITACTRSSPGSGTVTTPTSAPWTNWPRPTPTASCMTASRPNFAGGPTERPAGISPASASWSASRTTTRSEIGPTESGFPPWSNSSGSSWPQPPS